MKKPPSERRIGARIRIKPAHVDAIAALFAAVQIEPIYLEHRTDADFSFWFDKPTAAESKFIETVQAIPLACWAIHAIVGQPTFR